MRWGQLLGHYKPGTESANDNDFFKIGKGQTNRLTYFFDHAKRHINEGNDDLLITTGASLCCTLEQIKIMERTLDTSYKLVSSFNNQV